MTKYECSKCGQKYPKKRNVKYHQVAKSSAAIRGSPGHKGWCKYYAQKRKEQQRKEKERFTYE